MGKIEKPFPILKLPMELRYEIYKLVLPPQVQRVDRKGISSMRTARTQTRDATKRHKQHSLTRVNQQVRAESLPFFYSNRPLFLHVTPGKGPEPCLRLLKIFGNELRFVSCVVVAWDIECHPTNRKPKPFVSIAIHANSHLPIAKRWFDIHESHGRGCCKDIGDGDSSMTESEKEAKVERQKILQSSKIAGMKCHALIQEGMTYEGLKDLIESPASFVLR